MKLRHILPIALTLADLCASAQARNNNWIFGLGAWLDFNTAPPTVLAQPVDLASYPHTSMSDPNGDLLFYFDGRVFYNADLDTMPNGDCGLLSMPLGLSQYQSIALPRPGWPDRYFVFMIDQYLHAGYVEVDMGADDDLGDVISPEVTYYMDSAAETRIAATRHGNGTDYWVVQHERGSAEFYAFRLAEDGLDPVPVISNAGTVALAGFTLTDRYGRLKFSSQGDLLAHSSLYHYNSDSSTVELFHFDQSSGEVSLAVELPHFSAASGLEFSPDGNRFYCTHFRTVLPDPPTSRIWQFTLVSLVPADVLASGVEVGIDSSSFGLDQVGSIMELAPNGKIYLKIGAPDGVLAVINDPNAAGLTCGYERNGLDAETLGGVIYNLPNQCRRYHDSAPSWAAGIDNAPVAAAGLFTIHPNPAHDHVTFVGDMDAMPEEVQVFDALGRPVLRTTLAREGGVVVSNLASGIYTAMALDRQGAVIGSARFAKE